MLKRSYAIILLLFCSVPYLFFAFFHIKQSMVREKMKERLEQQALHTVTIPETELVWVKMDKEILLDGKMFDIKSITIRDGVCHITGLFDDEETALVNQLEKTQGSRAFPNHQWLIQFLQIFQAELPAMYLQPSIVVSINKAEAQTENLPAVFLPIVSPPPQAIACC